MFFLFPIFSMNSSALRLSFLHLYYYLLRSAFQMDKFNLLVRTLFQSSLLLYWSFLSIVSAGCKVKKLFETTKPFVKTFLLFSSRPWCLPWFKLLSLPYLSALLNLPDNRATNSKLYSQYLQWTLSFLAAAKVNFTFNNPTLFWNILDYYFSILFALSPFPVIHFPSKAAAKKYLLSEPS